MIINIARTLLQLQGYLGAINYPRTRLLLYSAVSIISGITLSQSPEAEELPILTLTAVLFGFTINAVVLLGNSSEHYLSTNSKYSQQLETYYKKSLSIAIHTLGIGLLTIVIAGLYKLYPVTIRAYEINIKGSTISVEIMGLLTYSILTYYLLAFTVVIASTAELVKIRM